MCELIAETRDATTPVGLRPFRKQPRHLTLGRDAHPVAPLIAAPLAFPGCWNHSVCDGSPTRIGTRRFDQAVFIKKKQKCRCSFAVLQSCLSAKFVNRFPLYTLAWQQRCRIPGGLGQKADQFTLRGLRRA